jgi:hypothetical protein
MPGTYSSFQKQKGKTRAALSKDRTEASYLWTNKTQKYILSLSSMPLLFSYVHYSSLKKILSNADHFER